MHLAEALDAHMEALACTLIEKGATRAELAAVLWAEAVVIERALQDLEALAAELLRGR